MRPCSQKLSLAITAIVAAFLFTFEQLTVASVSVRVASAAVQFETTAAIKIPASYGRIEHSFTSSALCQTVCPSIIHIQSAHGHYEAEKNIQKMLEYLHDHYGARHIFLEGGAGNLDPGLFNIFRGLPKLNKKIADTLVKEAELSGAELFLFDQGRRRAHIKHGLRSEKIKAYGLEATDAYRSNRIVFKRLIKHRKPVDAFFRIAGAVLEQAAGSGLNPALRNFMLVMRKHESGQMDYAEFLRKLGAAAENKLGIDLNDAFFQQDWPMLVRYFRLARLEGELNPAMIRHEAGQFLLKIKSISLSREDLEALRWIREIQKRGGVAALSAFHPADLHNIRYQLGGLLENIPAGIMNEYPRLRLYMQFLIMRNEISEKRLFEETDMLKAEIIKQMTRSAAEKLIVRLSKDYFLSRKLLTAELSRPEYMMLLRRGGKSVSSLKPGALLQRIRRLAGARFAVNVPPDFLRDAGRAYRLALVFYQDAVRRELDFAANVMNYKDEFSRDLPVILITGGFHADGMREYFLSQGFSYTLMTPGIRHVMEPDHYHRAMLEADAFHFQKSQIANRLMLQPVETIFRLGADLDHMRTQVLRAILQTGVSKEALRRADRRLLARQYGLRLASDPVNKGISLQKSARFERRAVEKALEDTTISVRENPLTADRSNLKFVLDALSSALNKRDENQETAALVALNHLIATNAPLRESPLYKSAENEIKRAVTNHLEFIKTFIYETTLEPLPELVPLRLKLFRGREKVRELEYPSADINELSGWVIKHKKAGKEAQYLQVILDSDTGPLPSQIERARFISLYTHLASRSFKPHYYRLQPEGDFFRRYHDRTGWHLGYFFRLSAGRMESARARESRVFKEHIAKKLREIQLLNLGMFLASAEETYAIFFPAEKPFWDREEGPMRLMAQAYRAFERRFVSFLREYNQFLNPAGIRRMGEDPRFHKERQHAAEELMLEELLYPTHPWLYPQADYKRAFKNPLKELAPLMRVFEALELQKIRDDEGRRIGSRFVERLEGIADEYLVAVNRILAGGSVHSRDSELSSEFIKAFSEAGKFAEGKYRNPFIDPSRLNETKYYVKRITDGLTKKSMVQAQLPDPESVKKMAAFYFGVDLLPDLLKSENADDKSGPSIRSERRVSLAELSTLKANFLKGAHAEEKDLAVMFEGLKDKDEAVRNLALSVLSYVVTEQPSLRDSPAYHENKDTIKKALVNHLTFVKTVLKETPGPSLDELVTLQATLFTSRGESTFEWSTSNIPSLADWIVRQRKGAEDAMLQVRLPYDTGLLASQAERGRFVALYLYLENRVLRPKFYHADPITERSGRQGHLGNVLRRDENGLNYTFRMASDVAETAETLKKKNVTQQIAKRFREIQLLNLGLLLASAEESYRIFFPGEIPFWAKTDRQIQSLSQAYRTFERRFVSLLREYNRYRNPDDIEDIIGPPSYHEERREAFQNFVLEEILFPNVSWLRAAPGEMDPLNHLLPYLRGLEGMQLNIAEGGIPFEGKHLPIGDEFIRRVEEVGDEFYIAATRILAGKSLGASELSQVFVQAFIKANDQFDPFVDRENEAEYTEYYFRKMKEALEKRQIRLDQVPNADVFRGPMRAETRQSSVSSKSRLTMIKTVTDGIVGEDAFGRKAYRFIYRNRVTPNKESRLLEALETKTNPVADAQVRVSQSAVFHGLFDGKDANFHILSMTLPDAINLTELNKIMKEFRPLIMHHGKTLFILSYSGDVSAAMRTKITRDYDRRIILLGTENKDILAAIYNPAIASKLAKEGRDEVKRLFTHASRLAGEPLKMGKLMQSSLVVADKSFFEEGLAGQIAKQFHQESLKGLPQLDLFRAQLLYGLAYSSVSNAELLRQVPAELKVEGDQDILRMSFKPAFAGDIKNLIQSIQTILRSA